MVRVKLSLSLVGGESTRYICQCSTYMHAADKFSDAHSRIDCTNQSSPRVFSTTAISLHVNMPDILKSIQGVTCL